MEHQGLSNMKTLTAVVFFLTSLQLFAQSTGYYNPNDRYKSNNNTQQQPSNTGSVGTNSTSGGNGGNTVGEVRATKEESDQMGQVLQTVGGTATGIGASGLVTCYMTEGSNTAAGEAVKTGVTHTGAAGGGANSWSSDTPSSGSSGGESESGGCGVWLLVTAGGIAMQLNGNEAKSAANKLQNLECEMDPSAPGCGGFGGGSGLPNGVKEPNLPQSLDDQISDIVSTIPERAGVSYDPDTKTFSGADGSQVSLNTAMNSGAMDQALNMLSGSPNVEKLKKMKKHADKVTSKAKVVSMGFSSGGGASGSRGSGGVTYEEDDSLDKLLAQMRNRNRKGKRNPSSVAAGKVSNYNGGPIGHKMDNLFDMIHRAYDKYTEMGYFYPPGTRLGPDGLPVRRNK